MRVHKVTHVEWDDGEPIHFETLCGATYSMSGLEATESWDEVNCDDCLTKRKDGG